MSDESSVRIRAFDSGDASDIQRLSGPEIERSSYPAGWRSAVDSLVRGSDSDARCVVAVLGQSIVGFAIHGLISGSLGAGRLQLIVTDSTMRRRGIARRLVVAAISGLREAGARFVIVELPDDPALSPVRALLEASGFRPEARVTDFFRDGVDLVVLRSELASG